MTQASAEPPRPAGPSRSGWAAPARFAAFAALTFAAGALGRLTFDETVRLSLVWPLYGVAVLWIASATRRSWPWDLLGMSAAVAASVLLDGGSWQQTVVATVLTAPAAVLWYAVMHRLVPDLWGAGGRRPLSRLSDLVAFITAGTVAATVVAALRSTGLGLVPAAAGPEEVLLTAVRNLSWILCLGALGLLVLPHGRRLGIRARTALRQVDGRPLWRVLETLVLLVATGVLTAVAFSPSPAPIAFSLVLATVWAGFRLPSVGALLLAASLGTVAVVATLQGQGAFRFGVTPLEAAAIAQAFLITQVVAALAISIGTDERRLAIARAAAAEREATERALLLGTVLENVDEGILAVRADGRHDLRNRPARRLLGSATGREAIGGGRILVSSGGEPLEPAESPFARALGGDDVVGEEYRVRHPHQPDVPVRVSAARVDPGQGGEPIVVCTFRDVTREHEERDQLVSFAGVVAHDLKNPLTVVRGWTESLREELEGSQPDVPVLRSMLTRVQGASDQMHHFIDDLLAFTVARDRPLDIAAVDLTAVAEEVAELRREGGTRPRITVQEGMEVRADRSLVRQLLDNLVGNSVKYVAPGVRPQVAVTAVERDGLLEVSVTDNGIGIPPAMRQRVFDSFARAHAGDYGGTGLGLAICERAVSRHGGRIWVDEDRDDGTRIGFTLPTS